MIADFHPAATRPVLRALVEADLSDMLPEVDVPTLLLCGELDCGLPTRSGSPFTKGSRTSRWSISPKGPHGGHAGGRALQRRDPSPSATVERSPNLSSGQGFELIGKHLGVMLGQAA